MEGQAYSAELSKCLIDSEANQLLPSPHETQPQYSAEGNQQSCVSPTCSAGCCVVLAPVGAQGGLLPDCTCARAKSFRGCKRRIWRSSELSTLVLLHSALGNKWSAIAKYLHGRSDNDCKNIFYSALRSKTSQTNRLLRTYAQAVGPNCDDPLARQNAYKAAKAQVAARNASLISRAAALAPRGRNTSRGVSTSDDDSEIPADAAAAAAQAAAALPQTDAVVVAAAAGADDGIAPEDIDPMDAGAYVSALQLQQATAAAAAAAAGGSSGGGGGSCGPQDLSPGTNSKALIRRLSAQSGNRDSSMYGGGSGGGSPSITPSFPQPSQHETVATATVGAAAHQHLKPSRSHSLTYRDLGQENQLSGAGRQHQPLPPPPQQHQLSQQQPVPGWTAGGRGLLHPMRHVRPRPPFNVHPSPLSTGTAPTSHDNPHLAAPSLAPPTYGAAAEGGGGSSGAPPENVSTQLPASASSTESLQELTPKAQPPLPPPLRRGSSGAAIAAAAAAAAAGSIVGRKDKARERGGSSTSSLGIAVKKEKTSHQAAATGSPYDTAALGPAAAQVPNSALGQGQRQSAAANPSLALDVRAGVGSFAPDGNCTPPGPSPQDMTLLHLASVSVVASHTEDGALASNLSTYYHSHHPAYTGMPLTAATPGTDPIAAAGASNAAAQGQALQHPAAAAGPLALPRLAPIAGPPGAMVYQSMPPSSCEELLSGGEAGPMGVPVTVPTPVRWDTSSPSGSVQLAHGISGKYEMLPPSAVQGPGLLVYPGGGWDLGSVEIVPCGGGGGATAASAGGAFAVLPPPPLLLQQQQHQYQLGLQLQAQLQAQQQQLQEQQVQLQAQLAQLQALQHQHHRLQQLQQQGPPAQQSPGSPGWIQGCGNTSPPPMQPPAAPQPPPPPSSAAAAAAATPSSSAAAATPVAGVRMGPTQLQSPHLNRTMPDTPLQPQQPQDDALTEMWLSMLE